MISYAANYPDDAEGIAGAKIINHQPLFNDRNTVEFAIGRDKRFIKLSETELNLQIEIPDNYYPDNDVTSKLFENRLKLRGIQLPPSPLRRAPLVTLCSTLPPASNA